MLRPPALVAAARHGLVPPASAVEIAESETALVTALAQHDHLSGFLVQAVLDGAVIADEHATETINESWHKELLMCVVLEALVVRTAGVLDAASIRWRLTKGAAVAHLDYPDPAVRTFGDADILIHPDDWAPAVTALTASGLRREAGTLGLDYDNRYGKGATLSTADGLQVDLHRRFAIGRFGVTSRMEDLFENGETINLAGRAIPVLAREDRLLHACFHASLGGFRRLRAFRDVAQLILHTHAGWEATFDTARRWRAEAVVATALIDAWRILQLGETHPALVRARQQKVSRADRHALEVFGEERPFRRQALTAVGRLRAHEIPRYLWSLAPPRRSGRNSPGKRAD